MAYQKFPLTFKAEKGGAISSCNFVSAKKRQLAPGKKDCTVGWCMNNV